MHGQPLPVADFTADEIRKDIQKELQFQGKPTPENLSLAIIDDQPDQQRLFIEFLVYHELFKSWGWNSTIADFHTVDLQKNAFIYNRYTDFYLNNPESAVLKKAFKERTTCLSPNPYEYFMLADKQRLIDWSNRENLARWQVPQEAQDLILSVVPASLDIHHDSKEDVWAHRKIFFFKPKRAFGSKQSYRGASISRKAFDEIVGQEFIAQEFVAAPEKSFETPDGPQNFKYDLRCYAYQGRLQLVVARLYQGQVTNLRTPYGGFACVEFR
jgi:hypothetical protein